MTCIEVTELLRRVYPASLEALHASVGRTRIGNNFLSGLIDVAYFFDSIGGSPETLNRLLRYAFRAGQAAGGAAPRRIPHEVINLIDDLEALWGNIRPSAFRLLIEDMASQYTKFRGGTGVLRFLRQRGYRDIVGLEILAESGRRIYDVVLSRGRHLSVEVKSWANWSGAPRGQWSSAGRQMARDLMSRSAEFIWIFYTGAEGATRAATTGGRALRRQILDKLFDGIGSSLFRQSRRRITPDQLIERLSRITERNLSRNGTQLLSDLLRGPRGVVANRDRLIRALEEIRSNPERFFHINPS